MSRDSETVSKNMRSIHSKDTSIELQLRKALWHKGYRYRKNYKALPGSPDIVLTKYKIAIFCDSEFFHGKDWEILKLRLEKGKNPDYWIKKIERNRSRDFETDKKLLFLGYTVIHFWGQDIKKHRAAARAWNWRICSNRPASDCSAPAARTWCPAAPRRPC